MRSSPPALPLRGEGARGKRVFRRRTFTACDVKARCRVCHEHVPGWPWGKNGVAVAARHTDATGHTTDVEQVVFIRYEAGLRQEEAL